MSACPMRKRPQYKVSISRFEGTIPTGSDEMYDDSRYQEAMRDGKEGACPADFPFATVEDAERQLRAIGWAKSDDGLSWTYRHGGGRGNQVSVGIIRICDLE